MRVRDIFVDMSTLADNINAVRAEAAAMAQKLDAGTALRQQLESLDGKADAIRTKGQTSRY